MMTKIRQYNKPTITLFRPHPGQAKVLKTIKNWRIDYTILSMGRRWGKTELAINLLIDWGISSKVNVMFGTFSSLQRDSVWRDMVDVKKLADAPFIKNINRVNYTITFMNGSTINFMLCSNPAVETIRGRAFDKVILDEFALYPDKAFEEIIEPTLATTSMRKRSCVIMSTPRGRGKFYQLFQKGLDANETKWRSFNLPTTDNPLVSQEFVTDVKKRVSDKVYKQEYLAEFIDDVGDLFENVKLCSTDTLSSNPAKAAGIDLGFTEDYSVVWIIDKNNNIVEYDRFNKIDMSDAVNRIYELLRRHNWPRTNIENNMYQGVFEMLKKKGCRNIHQYNTNTSTKKKMIEDLCQVFQDTNITLPNDEYILEEFISFNYNYNQKTRNISYSAPQGMHDDCVMACAMAIQANKSSGGAGITFA